MIHATIPKVCTVCLYAHRSLTIPRPPHDRDCNIRDALGHPRPPDGTRTIDSSTSLSRTHTIRSTNLGLASKTTPGSYQASDLYHRSAHDCSDKYIGATVGSSFGHYFLAWHTCQGLGFTYGKVGAGVQEGHRQSRDIWRGVSARRTRAVRMER